MRRTEMLCLIDNVDGDRFYDYRLGEGIISSWRSDDPDRDAAKICGFYMKLRTGILSRTEKQFCFLSRDSKLLLDIDSQVFDFTDPKLTAKFTNRFPFIRNFSLLRDGRFILNLKYRFFSLREWPDDGDLLRYVAETTASPSERQKTIDAWRERRPMT